MFQGVTCARFHVTWSWSKEVKLRILDISTKTAMRAVSSATITPSGWRPPYRFNGEAKERHSRSGRGGEDTNECAVRVIETPCVGVCIVLDTKRKASFAIQECGSRDCKAEDTAHVESTDYGLLHALAALSPDFKFYTELVSLKVTFRCVDLLTNFKEHNLS